MTIENTQESRPLEDDKKFLFGYASSYSSSLDDQKSAEQSNKKTILEISKIRNWCSQAQKQNIQYMKCDECVNIYTKTSQSFLCFLCGSRLDQKKHKTMTLRVCVCVSVQNKFGLKEWNRKERWRQNVDDRK